MVVRKEKFRKGRGIKTKSELLITGFENKIPIAVDYFVFLR